MRIHERHIPERPGAAAGGQAVDVITMTFDETDLSAPLRALLDRMLLSEIERNREGKPGIALH